MSVIPPLEVIRAIESGTTYITRRCEIYEADAVTRWRPNDPARLVDGNITVDYNSDERRKLDIELSNSDNILRPEPTAGFWYDKIIKVFRGIRYPTANEIPPVAIVEGTTGDAEVIRSLFSNYGYTDIDTRVSETTLASLARYPVLVSYTKTTASAKSTMLKEAYDLGRNVITISTGNTNTQIPLFNTGSAVGTARDWGVTAVTDDSPLAGSYTGTEIATPTATGWAVSTLVAGAMRASSFTPSGGSATITVSVGENNVGGKWIDFHLPNLNGTKAKQILGRALEWIRGFEPYKTWEVQQGEFMVDNIKFANFPKTTHVTGRDYTKKCLTSKLTYDSTFKQGTTLTQLVRSLAANCGITKMRLHESLAKLQVDLSYPTDTSRWQIMKEATQGLGYELFFDNEGYLVMRPFIDPTTGPVTGTFLTGPQGNLETYERSVNDSRIFNHIIVVGLAPVEGGLPVIVEAKNENPGSPTRISRLGTRSMKVEVNWTSDETILRDTAAAYLKVYALESYEISWTALYYPWLEVGEIVQFLDPDARAHEPDRFLMDQITYPVALGPMSCTGKRVTYVGSSGG